MAVSWVREAQTDKPTNRRVHTQTDKHMKIRTQLEKKKHVMRPLKRKYVLKVVGLVGADEFEVGVVVLEGPVVLIERDPTTR